MRPEPVGPSSQWPRDEQTTIPWRTGANVVRELLASAHPVERVWIRGGTAQAIASLAAGRRVPVEQVTSDELEPGSPWAHQGVVARPFLQYAELDHVVTASGTAALVLDAHRRPAEPGSHPANGACRRVAGVILPKDRAVGVTAAVAQRLGRAHRSSACGSPA